MELALGTLFKWAKENGQMGANPSKTELILFTRKYKILDFSLPRLDDVTLEFSKDSNCLCAILDSQLSCKRHEESHMQKDLCALYTCKKDGV